MAGDAEPFRELSREPAAVIANLKAQNIEKGIRRQSEYWSTSRLRERNREERDGDKIRIRGKQRYLYNQMELGVLSKANLRKVIEGGGPERLAGAITLTPHR